MQAITLIGQASGKSWQLKIEDDAELELTVLEFLRAKNIPVASSCDGEKVCRLCCINDNLLACCILVKDIVSAYNNQITISYL